MANLDVQPIWTEVRQLETHELARGGLNGNMNEQAKSLASRTEFLKKEKEKIELTVTPDSSVDIKSGFNINNAQNLKNFLAGKRFAKIQPDAQISIESNIVIDLTNTNTTEIDLQGATLNFKTGGRITFKGKSIPYLTTNVTADFFRGQTSFKVSSTQGIEKGDLVIIKSPVLVTSAAKLSQTYLVQGVDTNTKEVYVMSYLVGDMRADQISAQMLTGNVTAEFYKIANHIKIKNGKITSLSRDDESTEIFIDGFRFVDVEGLIPDKPTRTGVNLGYCGIVNIGRCYTQDVGYVENDQGYNSIPSNPQGLGYGYGFLAANCYVVNFFNNDILAGWHGLDVAVGVTFANAFGNSLHKGAFGISSHEGQWVLNVFGNIIQGGHAVTCRSFELCFKSNIGRGIKNRFIIGSRRMQSVVIQDNDVEISKGYTGNFIYFDGAYPESCFSNEEPVAIIKGNNFRGMSGVESRIRVWKNLDILSNNFEFSGGSTSISVGALVNTGVLNIGGNTSKGNLDQNVYSISEQFAEVNIWDEVDMTKPTLGSSATIFSNVALPLVNLIGNKVHKKNMLFRNMNNSEINFNHVFDNKSFAGTIFEWGVSNSTVQKYFRNTTKTAIPSSNLVNYVQQSGNLVLDRSYSASKTHDWPSIAAGAITNTTMSLNGAIPGEHIVASMDINLGGARIWAEVTATNVVTVYIHNLNSTPIDLPSGKLTIKSI